MGDEVIMKTKKPETSNAQIELLSKIEEQLEARGYKSPTIESLTTDSSTYFSCIEFTSPEGNVIIEIPLHWGEKRAIIDRMNLHTIGQDYIKIVVYPNNTASYLAAKYDRCGEIYIDENNAYTPNVSIGSCEKKEDYVSFDTMEAAFNFANEQIDKFDAIADKYRSVVDRANTYWEKMREADLTLNKLRKEKIAEIDASIKKTKQENLKRYIQRVTGIINGDGEECLNGDETFISQLQ